MEGYYIAKTLTTSWVLFAERESGFGDSIHSSVANVLAEVRKVFIDIFGLQLVEAHPFLSVLQDQDGPITFRKHYLIFLSSKGLYHLQHIYQFSHELCHFMVPDEVCKTYRWFEETLCEAMSWYSLWIIEQRGEVSPILELGPLYPTISEYIPNSQSKRASLSNQPLSAYVSSKLPYLCKDCYNRAVNATIAYEIFPLFREHPELWKIVPHLHTLTDDMPLSEALHHLSRVAGVVETGGESAHKAADGVMSHNSAAHPAPE